MKNIIVDVIKDSIAQELGIEKGDELVSVNNSQITDYIDYKFQISDEFILLEIKKKDDEIWEFEIEKDYDEDLGIVFENPLMDNIKVCSNHCIFCFIDQMPKGMRKSLYIKDDDTRMSFLYGNFITLTNLTDEEIDRIVKYRISPIKVSVHTTDNSLRKYMMGNKKEKDIMKYLKKLADAGITVDCQIVLVKDVNDKEYLTKSIYDLKSLYPHVRSVAVVPVGVTKCREKLEHINSFDEKSAKEVVMQVENLQYEMMEAIDTRFVFIADEFYILSNTDFPIYESYEDFDQLENGIGMCRLILTEVKDTLEKICNKENCEILLEPKFAEVTIVTGKAAYDVMKNISKQIEHKINIKINVIKINNEFFGDKITVSGLITGKDIISQLKGKEFKNIIMPSNMFNDNNVMLDDLTVEDLEENLNTNVSVCDLDGEKLVRLILKNTK